MSIKEVWIAYVDEEDGGDRENWSVFYCEPIVAETKQAVKNAAQLKVTQLASETAMDCDGDLSDLASFEGQLHVHVIGPISILK